MLDFDTALALVLQNVSATAHERVPLGRALGRVLAEPLTARRPLPEFDYSAMDGYAVRSADLVSHSASLLVQGTSSAGSAPSELTSGTAQRIFTGGPLPRGADAVVMQENAERDADRVRFTKPPVPGDHVRYAGEDLKAGALALPEGTRLGPFQLGLAAALDYGEVVVAQQPPVSILCTGDELRPPGSAARPGSIPESNGIALSAMVLEAGGLPHLCPSTSDEPEATRRALENALALGDVVVTVGGVSVGDRDIVRDSLEALGISTMFHKVAIKPGKPVYFGTLGRKRILGLPGNPASAQVTFGLFGVPLLKSLQGMSDPLPRRVQARLTAAIHQRPGRRVFHRATLDGDRVTPLDNQASGATTAMAWSNALIVVSETTSELEAGASVEVIPFREL